MNQALPQHEHHPAGSGDSGERIAGLVERARRAMAEFHSSDQARVDEAVTALAWSLYKPEHATQLAALAVEDTGLGNAADKVIKNQRKTFGTLRDLMRVRSVGVIEEDADRGIVKYAKPVGVVAALTPSTNPAATPVNKSMMAVKGRNAVIVAPSPAGLATTTTTVDYMRRELARIGAPADLVQVLPSPVDRAATSALMEACDLVVVTGSQKQRARCLPERHPRGGRRGRQRSRDHRQQRRSRRRGGQDRRLQDLRQRDLVLLGKRARHSRRRL